MHLATIATLPSTASRAFTLTMGGEDLNITGESGAAFRVDIDSIEIDEQGPGGISGMTFDVYDTGLVVNIRSGALVEFWDVTSGWPLFRGFVQSWTERTEAPGRTLKVDCIGIEVLLDWLLIPANEPWVIPVGQVTSDSLTQKLYAVANGVGIPLNTGRADSPTQGNKTFPLGSAANPIAPLTGQPAANLTTPAGTTLREALRAVSEWVNPNPRPYDFTFAASVDFYGGLRIWYLHSDEFLLPSTALPTYPEDYPVLTIVEAGAGIHASRLDHTTDASSIYAAVLVQGGNAAGSGVVSAGSNAPGPVGVLSDTNITTSADRDTLGRAWLVDKVIGTRGSLDILGWTPGSEYRAGGHIVITNSQVGLSAQEFIISSIRKTFIRTSSGVRQNWRVSYGSLPPSVVRDVRRRMTT